MVTYIFCCKIIVYILSSLISKNIKKIVARKKDMGEECTKSLLCDANYDRENNDKFYTILFYMPDTFYLSSYLNKLCFELPQNVTWTDE